MSHMTSYFDPCGFHLHGTHEQLYKYFNYMKEDCLYFSYLKEHRTNPQLLLYKVFHVRYIKGHQS